jgi:ketosteroid isomerase-like protein
MRARMRSTGRSSRAGSPPGAARSGYEVRDFSVTTGDDIAFCHGFVRISGTKTDGGENSVWARQTLCLRKIDGAWKITHEHTSVPFYMDGSFKAAVDLAP